MLLRYVMEKGLFGKGDEDCVFLFLTLSILCGSQVGLPAL